MEKAETGDGRSGTQEILCPLCHDSLPGRLGKVEFFCQLPSCDGPEHLPD